MILWQDTRPRRYASALALALLGLHLWAALLTGSVHVALMHAVTWGCDVVALLVVTLAVAPLPRPGGLLVLTGLGALLASYPLLLTESLNFPVNIFTAGVQVTRFFVGDLFGSTGVIAVAAVLGGAYLIYRFVRPWPITSRFSVAIALISLVGVGAGVAGFAPLNPHPHPLVYSLQNTVAGWFDTAPAVAPLTRPERAASPAQPVPTPMQTEARLAYDRIFLIVMETVDTAKFEADFMTIPGGFYARHRDLALYFDNYYTTNLDSYTALIAMLTGQQVPFRAYEDPEQFAPVNAAPSLITALGGRGWASLFICTADYLPDVAAAPGFDRILDGQNFPDRQGWSEMGLNNVEASVEDRIAIPAMIDFAAAHRQAVVMQELVVGHSPQYQALTGLGQMAYYDSYLTRLYDGLQAQGLAAGSLIVLVADHGARTDAANAQNYQVPLMFVGDGVTAGVRHAMYSHLDLQALIATQMAALPMPDARDEVLVIGHTGRWSYGRISAHGAYQFIDASSGVVKADSGGLDPQETRARMQARIDAFAQWLDL